MRAFLILLISFCAFGALFADPLINYTGNYSACPGWTAYAAASSSDYALNDSHGYSRACQNVTYISYCVSRPNFIDYDTSRSYWGINCTDSNYCQGWTRAYPESAVNITETDPATNFTRQCTVSSYVAWCIKEITVVDYTIGHRYNQTSCTDWQQNCGFAPDKTQSRTERSVGGRCRYCNDTTYRYFCNNSGQVSWGDAQVQTSCAPWGLCLQFDQSGLPGSNSTSSSSSSSFKLPAISFDMPAVTIAVLFGVTFTAILLLFFGRQKTE